MGHSTRKRIVTYLVIFGIILILTGLGFTLKELMDGESLFDFADDSSNYKVTFNLNGSNMIEHKSVRCKAKEDGCLVTLPNATRKNGIVLGYSDNKNDTEAKYELNSTITIKNNMALYAISYQENKLTIEKNGVDYLEKDTVTCKMYNEEKGCNVVLPKYNKIGYETKGYSTSNESLVGFAFANDTYEINKDTVMYPIYGTSSRHRSLNITKVFNYQDSIIEVERGCNESVYKEYLKYLDDMSKYVPFLLLGNKITFVTDNSFDTIWGKNYVGMNYGPKTLRSVDIRCSNKVYNDYYATMVHEMAHSWDFYYAKRMGENISSQSDIINLYSKYKNTKNRPFRDYSYSNIYEFVADMMRYYYFKYNVPKSNFKNLNYPSDLKKALEKYICIAKNNYKEEGCVK